jgi:hypothetical protein
LGPWAAHWYGKRLCATPSVCWHWHFPDASRNAHNFNKS